MRVMITNTGDWVSYQLTLTTPHRVERCLQMFARHGCSSPSRRSAPGSFGFWKFPGLCGLLTLGQELCGRRVYFFCDNTVVWRSLITGYSSSKMMARVKALLHLFVAALDIDLWVEWVNTDAIIADPDRKVPS